MRGDEIGQGRPELVELFRLSEVPGLVEILHRQKRNEVRVFDVIVDLEIDHGFDGSGRIEILDLDLLFERNEIFVHGLQGRQIQAFLAAEVVVDHPLVDAASLGDVVGAGGGKSPLAEFADRRLQDLCASGVGVALLRFSGWL